MIFETDIITSIKVSKTRWDVILVITFVESFKTDVTASIGNTIFIGNVIMYLWYWRLTISLRAELDQKKNVKISPIKSNLKTFVSE